MRSLRKSPILALSLLWVTGVTWGVSSLVDYSARPGATAAAPSEWPTGSAVTRDADLPTLVMITHPRCACSKASVGELARLLSRFPHQVATRVLFVRPDGLPDGWERTGLWDNVAAIPGVTAISDPGGLESARFGSTTSGHVMLFDRDGARLFEGGLTASRGHEGESVGREAIDAILAGQVAERETSPVFGCPIQGNDQAI